MAKIISILNLARRPGSNGHMARAGCLARAASPSHGEIGHNFPKRDTFPKSPTPPFGQKKLPIRKQVDPERLAAETSGAPPFDVVFVSTRSYSIRLLLLLLLLLLPPLLLLLLMMLPPLLPPP
ncbi:hypothetical protein AOQ84DRAFT_222453 [Glonium stellatum]|uniref:Uncharacterized protein n=1 Tax=Glonium stellatum TaxID=574774 RepID=A0A8E2EZX0_9PEZI|nr:hypothetical protein AOQ84DRAFT_222453 [Glonium stellatum]